MNPGTRSYRSRVEQQRAVRDRPVHADRLVDADRRLVLAADEQADGRHALQQEAAEVAHATLPVPVAARARVDPDLLHLDRARRPRGRLGLEQDRAVLEPEPGPRLLDLRLRPPAERVGVACERVDAELQLVGRGAGDDEPVEVGERRRAQPGVARRRAARPARTPAGPGRSSRGGGNGRRAACHRSVTALSSPISMRACPPRTDSANAPQPRPDGTTFAPRWQSASRRSPRSSPRKRPSRAPRGVLEENALDRILRAEGEHLVERRFHDPGHGAIVARPAASRQALGLRPMPIHLRAEPGDYAEGCLLPGDPLRAKYIADTFMRGRAPGERRARDARLHGHVPRPPRVRPVVGHGLPVGRHRDRGADPARREEDPPRRHLRRPPGRSRDRRPDHRALGRAGRLDRDAPDRRRAARADGRLGAHPRRRAQREGARQEGARRPDRLQRRLLQPRLRASTAAGRTAASSPSRWRRPCCSRSARSRRSRPAAC